MNRWSLVQQHCRYENLETTSNHLREGQTTEVMQLNIRYLILVFEDFP